MDVATLAPSLEPTSELKMYWRVRTLWLASEPLSKVTDLPRLSVRSTRKGSLERGWYIEPTFLTFMRWR